LGYSTSQGPLGSVGISEHNLLGAGNDLRLDFTLSGVQSQINLSYTEPYFLDKPISAGFDIFRVTTDLQSESSFSENDIGAGLRAGYDIQEYLRQTWHYTFTRTNITDVSNHAAEAIQDEKGVTYSSVIGQELLYDRRDNRIDPQSGYYIRLRNDVAGIGGATLYVPSRIAPGYYYPLWERTNTAATGEIGYIQGLGQGVRVNDAFFIGGTTFRGFAQSGIGPRDRSSNDALGGNKYAIGTLEFSFPLPL